MTTLTATAATTGRPTDHVFDVSMPPRERLIEGLAVIIARDGYGNSKIRDIAAAAHVSLRTFYAEFTTKDEVLVALERVVSGRMLRTIRALVVFDGVPRAVVHRAFSALIELLIANPNLTRAILLDLATLGNEAGRTREVALQDFTALLCELVDDGQAAYPDLSIRPLTPFMARSIIGAVAELSTSRAALRADVNASQCADTMTDLLLSVVLWDGALSPGSVARDAGEHAPIGR